jgi:hypothetical protein
MFGSTQMNTTASRAKLVFAIATRTPNLSISGSFWNCGAPPDKVMTVAMFRAPMTDQTIVAANAANQSSGPGVAPSRWEKRAKIDSATTAVTAKLLTLNRILSGDWWDTTTRAAIVPMSNAPR